MSVNRSFSLCFPESSGSSLKAKTKPLGRRGVPPYRLPSRLRLRFLATSPAKRKRFIVAPVRTTSRQPSGARLLEGRGRRWQHLFCNIVACAAKSPAPRAFWRPVRTQRESQKRLESPFPAPLRPPGGSYRKGFAAALASIDSARDGLPGDRQQIRRQEPSLTMPAEAPGQCPWRSRQAGRSAVGRIGPQRPGGSGAMRLLRESLARPRGPPWPRRRPPSDAPGAAQAAHSGLRGSAGPPGNTRRAAGPADRTASCMPRAETKKASREGGFFVGFGCGDRI